MNMPKRIWDRCRSYLVPGFFLIGLNACGGYAAGDYLGATPGGAQDIGLARKIISDGSVPTVEDFTPEGLYSEHDLEIANAAPCGKTLCVNTAAGLEFGLDDDKRDLFVQFGMQSSISEASFQRKPLNLGIVIDTSGSMDINLEGVKSALHA